MTVQIEMTNGIGCITFSRPEKRNAITLAMMDEICTCLQDWAADPDELTDDEYQDEYPVISGQFAGIEMSEFALAAQHARRMVVIWVAVVLALTGMVAAAAWTIGSNLSGLL